MTAGMQERARRVRQRAQLRAWEYRQRRHASGVWFRLRRVLADAETAFDISEEDAGRLIAEGYATEPVGDELAPKKTIVFAPKERILHLASRREIPLSLGAATLAARAIALVRWP